MEQISIDGDAILLQLKNCIEEIDLYNYEDAKSGEDEDDDDIDIDDSLYNITNEDSHDSCCCESLEEENDPESGEQELAALMASLVADLEEEMKGERKATFTLQPSVEEEVKAGENNKATLTLQPSVEDNHDVVLGDSQVSYQQETQQDTTTATSTTTPLKKNQSQILQKEKHLQEANHLETTDERSEAATNNHQEPLEEKNPPSQFLDVSSSDIFRAKCRAEQMKVNPLEQEQKPLENSPPSPEFLREKLKADQLEANRLNQELELEQKQQLENGPYSPEFLRAKLEADQAEADRIHQELEDASTAQQQLSYNSSRNNVHHKQQQQQELRQQFEQQSKRQQRAARRTNKHKRKKAALEKILLDSALQQQQQDSSYSTTEEKSREEAIQILANSTVWTQLCDYAFRMLPRN